VFNIAPKKQLQQPHGLEEVRLARGLSSARRAAQRLFTLVRSHRYSDNSAHSGCSSDRDDCDNTSFGHGTAGVKGGARSRHPLFNIRAAVILISLAACGSSPSAAPQRRLTPEQVEGERFTARDPVCVAAVRAHDPRKDAADAVARHDYRFYAEEVGENTTYEAPGVECSADDFPKQGFMNRYNDVIQYNISSNCSLAVEHYEEEYNHELARLYPNSLLLNNCNEHKGKR
jgi:hypothetical protein